MPSVFPSGLATVVEFSVWRLAISIGLFCFFASSVAFCTGSEAAAGVGDAGAEAGVGSGSVSAHDGAAARLMTIVAASVAAVAFASRRLRRLLVEGEGECPPLPVVKVTQVSCMHASGPHGCAGHSNKDSVCGTLLAKLT
ncbi:hypothetical protein GCM10023075_20720 [Streptosporangium album]